MGEQTDEYFTTSFLTKISIDHPLVNELYLKLTAGDIIDSNGKNLSQDIRRYFLFGIKQTGGNNLKKKHYKKTHKRKTHKRKTHKRKTYKRKI